MTGGITIGYDETSRYPYTVRIYNIIQLIIMYGRRQRSRMDVAGSKYNCFLCSFALPLLPLLPLFICIDSYWIGKIGVVRRYNEPASYVVRIKIQVTPISVSSYLHLHRICLCQSQPRAGPSVSLSFT